MKRKLKTQSVRLPSELVSAYRKVAHKEGRTIQGLMSLVLRNELQAASKRLADPKHPNWDIGPCSGRPDVT